MKRNTLFVLCALVGLNAFAQMAGSASSSYKIRNDNPVTGAYNKGYKGFVDITPSLFPYDGIIFGIGAHTTHGYQFSPYFFAGAGIGINYNEDIYVPIFGELRFNLQNPNTHKNTPFIGMRIGIEAVCTGLYIDPFIGYRIPLGNSPTLNIGIGCQLMPLDPWDDELCPFISIHTGIEF